MGNQSAKSNSANLFSSDELKILDAAFKVVCSHEKCSKQKLLSTWEPIIDSHLAQCTANFLYTSGQQTVQTIQQSRFMEPYYIADRGTIDEKLNFLVGSFENNDSSQFAIKQLELYVASVLRSYLKIHCDQDTEIYESWKKYGYHAADRTVVAFAKGLTRNLSIEYEHRVEFDKLERWLQCNPTFLILWREVFVYAYSKTAGKPNRLGHSSNTALILPINEANLTNTHYIPILDLPHVIFVNSHLPNERRHKWRMLFSSVVMGESFSTMLGKILNKGPTLIIVEDEDRYIFGGYAPESWSMKPKFGGDDSSLLFTLSPAMRCFNTTGYNDHYQYLNLGQQTMPNGLGMGGQHNFWGLWIDSNYGLGHSSETCTTYKDYVQLSKRKEFKIRNLEVWGVGEEPKLTEDSDDEEETGKGRSVLDKHMEDKAMLEMTGRKMHSEGLREPDPDLGL